jgi:outer membrane protein OmpA-like peptidoglycan-associated protein
MKPIIRQTSKWAGTTSALGLCFAMGLSGCSLLTVKQDNFSPLQVSVARPAAPPPRVVLTDSSITIAEKIQFAVNSADILPASDGLLNEIGNVLKENPQIEVVQVEGHTDNTGSADLNKKLSQKRAESVKAALVSRGVVAKRIVSKGFGMERPMGPNTTDEGREKNRRVEFNIVKQGPKKTTVQD